MRSCYECRIMDDFATTNCRLMIPVSFIFVARQSLLFRKLFLPFTLVYEVTNWRTIICAKCFDNNYSDFCRLLLSKQMRWYCSQLSKARKRNIYLMLFWSAVSLVACHIRPILPNKAMVALVFFAVPWTAVMAAQCQTLEHPSSHRGKRFFPLPRYFTRSNQCYSICL